MDKLDNIKISEITSFIAEVFFEEMQFLFGKEKNKVFWVKNHGMNSRAFSKDIVDLSSYNYVVHDDIKESVFVHLSRNSIYHQLPESFFHPLVISSPSMSNAEVVEAIKKNKKIEDNNIQFFIPFDTELFKKKVQLANRYINIFTDAASKKTLFGLAQKVIDKDIPLTKEQYYKLFLNLCDSENYKENLPELEILLKQIMGFEVLLKYIPHIHSQSPFLNLGYGILGYNLGLQGNTKCEFDDIEAVMIISEKINYENIKKYKIIIEMILEFFVFSNRSILVKLQTKKDTTLILGENYLGYNTSLVV